MYSDIGTCCPGKDHALSAVLTKRVYVTHSVSVMQMHDTQLETRAAAL